MKRQRLTKRYSLLLVCSLSLCAARAQQQFHLTQYMMNPYALNPATGGTEADVDLRVGTRQQWLNFPGAPKTYFISGNTRIKVLRKPNPFQKATPFHSVGGLIYQDQAGPITRTSVLAAYSYNIPLSSNLNLAMGVSGGVVRLYLDKSKLQFDQDGEVVNFPNRVMPDGNVGMWLYNSDFFTGFSINQLFINELDMVQDYDETPDKARLVHHYYLTGGYNIPLGYATGRQGVHEYYLVPSVMLKYAGSHRPSVDVNVKIKKKDLLWLGASYRHGDAVALLGGLTIFSYKTHALELGYSYDRTVNALRSASFGSHEVILVYKLKKSQIVCPDNFW